MRPPARGRRRDHNIRRARKKARTWLSARPPDLDEVEEAVRVEHLPGAVQHLGLIQIRVEQAHQMELPVLHDDVHRIGAVGLHAGEQPHVQYLVAHLHVATRDVARCDVVRVDALIRLPANAVVEGGGR